jgi:hypothetical protein
VARLVAFALLAVVALFLGAMGFDACEDDGDCPPGCHVSCRDGCSSAPVTAPQHLAPAAALEREAPPAPAARPLDRTSPPETAPPRI